MIFESNTNFLFLRFSREKFNIKKGGKKDLWNSNKIAFFFINEAWHFTVRLIEEKQMEICNAYTANRKAPHLLWEWKDKQQKRKFRRVTDCGVC